MDKDNTNEQTSINKTPIVGLKWGPIASLVVSIIAYIASVLIMLVPFTIIKLINQDQDVLTVLSNSPWLELALMGISSITMLTILYLFLKRRKSSIKELGFSKIKNSDVGWLVFGAFLYYAALILALSLARIIPGFDLEQSQDIGYQTASGWQLGLAFIGLVVLPPLAEEMLFRGFLYRGLASKWPKLLAALVASVLFAVVHFQWNVGVDVFVLSLVMILLYEKTKNLWVCVGLHALKNAIAFLVLFVF